MLHAVVIIDQAFFCDDPALGLQVGWSWRIYDDQVPQTEVTGSGGQTIPLSKTTSAAKANRAIQEAVVADIVAQHSIELDPNDILWRWLFS